MVGWLSRRAWMLVAFAVSLAASPLFAQTYTYDALGRVTQVVYSSGATIAYSYDNAGNRTSLTVTGAQPVAGPVNLTVGVNSSGNNVPLNVTGGAANSVAVSAQAGHGTATASGSTISYTPTAGYAGADSFQYTAANSAGVSSPATVSIRVVGPPVAGPVSVTVGFNSTNNVVSPNLSGGAASSVAVFTSPGHGAATATGTSLSYTPAAGFVGPDSFQYTATNVAGTSAPGTVSIVVNVQAPVANDSSQNVALNSTNNVVSLNVTGGAPTSVAVAVQATHGAATASGTSITYTPAAGFTGTDVFQYTASNAGGTSAAATVSLRVEAPPVAGPTTASVNINSVNNPIALSITGGSPDSVAVSTQALHGSATATGTSITYSPASGYAGPDSFHYSATNVAGTSSPAKVSITVSGTIVVVLTSGSSWTVPANWNSSHNTIQLIGGGAGGGGGSAGSSTPGRGGGGGGAAAYAGLANYTLTPGAVVPYAIGAGGAGGGAGQDGQAGGATSFGSGIGTLTLAGGSGGKGSGNGGAGGGGGFSGNGGGTGGKGDNSGGGGGGAGAGGPNGAGQKGGNGGAGGGGGGGSDGGSSTGGSNGASTAGGDGGLGTTGSGAGAGATGAGAPGGGGAAGGGGGGAFGAYSGGQGGGDTALTSAVGSGGGGGGGGSSTSGGPGGAGGGYGGGGGGGGGSTASGTAGAGGSGSQGVIVITYTP